MRHADFAITSSVGTLTATVSQLARLGRFIAATRCPQLLPPCSLAAGRAAIPLPVVAASTDRKDGVATGITTPAEAKPIWAFLSGGRFRHSHHNKPC